MTYYGASELARGFRTVRKNLLTIAEEIPEEQYDRRPAPGCRSAREILAHLVTLSEGAYQGHAVRRITTFIGVDFPALIRQRMDRERELSSASQAQLVEMLRRGGEDWGRYLDAVTEEELAVVIPFPAPAEPPSKSRFEMLLSVKEHEMHHRAQLMVIERVVGLVPHLTREREARMGPPPAARP